MDLEANEEPETLDPQRRPTRHLAFGTGIHLCLGYQLARMEGRCALEVLFGRRPNASLVIQPADIRMVEATWP